LAILSGDGANLPEFARGTRMEQSVGPHRPANGTL